VDTIDPARPVAVICHSGMRSRTATRILRAHAIEAANVKGGMRAWTGSALPVVMGAARGSR
jgi:rhodanese-related sulfurtransferase